MFQNIILFKRNTLEVQLNDEEYRTPTYFKPATILELLFPNLTLVSTNKISCNILRQIAV